MSRQYKTRSSDRHSSDPAKARFGPSPVLQPKATKKTKKELPEWKPGGNGVDWAAKLSQIPLQAKSYSGQSSDPQEQQADTMAKTVVERISAPYLLSREATLQRAKQNKLNGQLQMKSHLQREPLEITHGVQQGLIQRGPDEYRSLLADESDSESDSDDAGYSAISPIKAEIQEKNQQIRQGYPQLQQIGRQAKRITEKLESKRTDEAVAAVKDLGITWGKAGIFAVGDLILPGLGTGLGYADAAYGTGTAIREKRKLGKGGTESAKQTVEQGAAVGAESLHWTAATVIGSGRALYKGGKAIAESDDARKKRKMSYFAEFAKGNSRHKQEILNRCQEIIHLVHDIHKLFATKPEVEDDPDIERIVKSFEKEKIVPNMFKAQERIEKMFATMATYEERHTEYGSLLAGAGSGSGDLASGVEPMDDDDWMSSAATS
ncbi:hypothetical protein [Roseofilum capinflatum]|uniref:Uncharacterized protein n=1 Tax=Roseofilum capinflatum BLCC-M114 TaxID=3022440 RepID=A0ABT7B0D0_9CYAN|nr:hypothetical protein [Roseofilum capinflatum]MDJ1172586.1 hypothetical protein [Roseofilum capinflatum BLCC-M114]